MTKLDKSKPFSATYGGENGTTYTQNGQEFDSNGEPIGVEKAPEMVESEAPKKRGRPRKE